MKNLLSTFPKVSKNVLNNYQVILLNMFYYIIIRNLERICLFSFQEFSKKTKYFIEVICLCYFSFSSCSL